MKILNPKWKEAMLEKIATCERKPVDETLSLNMASQWLICELSDKNIEFRVYNLGAGVKRITTTTDCCPLCKNKLYR